MSRRFLWSAIALVLVGFILYTFLRLDEREIPSWKANPKSAPRKSGHYHAIIVGGGVGGLTSGALLAKNGYKVLIAEKNPNIGGFCSKYTIDGFTFGLGTWDINGIWDRGPVTYLLKQLGLDQKKLLVRNSRRFFVGDASFDVEKGLLFEEALIKQFGEEKEAISRFFKKAKIVYEAVYDKTMVGMWGIPLPKEIIPIAMPEKWISEYQIAHKELLEWQDKTYQELLDEYFKSSRLKKVMSSILKHLGGLPAKTKASDVIIQTFGYFFFDGYQPLQTSYHFAEALAAYITAHGGTILTNSTVDTILVENGAAKGIQVGTRSFYAPVVISNVNAKTTYLDLVDEALSSKFLKSIR
jgi:all-trans-retinol 13,14-reductase